MDGNEDDAEAVCGRFQGQGGAEGDPGEPAAKHGTHPTMIAMWKRQAVDGMAATLSGGIEAAKAAGDTEIEKLHVKIGQLVMERDFCRRDRAMSIARRRQMIEREHAHLAIAAQCRPVSINRSSFY